MSLCEICDRQILTKDWASHKNSRKHRAAEAKEREELEKLKNPGGSFSGDATGFGDINEFRRWHEFASANMIAQSQSGTTKTAAFSLNILSRVDLSNPRPQALALAPSRELARQILGVITHMGQFMEGLTTMAAIPDPSRGESLGSVHDPT
ncbi:unnamed protein product [Alternaria alternata]